RASGLQHAVVPAGAAGVLHAARHVAHAEAVVELPAGLPALADFQHRAAERVAVAKADRALVEPTAADVLAEGAGRRQHRQLAELRAPGGIVVEGVVVDGLVDAAMQAEVALLVALQAEFADAHAAAARRLGDAAAAARARVGHGRAGEQGIDADAGADGCRRAH